MRPILVVSVLVQHLSLFIRGDLGNLWWAQAREIISTLYF